MFDRLHPRTGLGASQFFFSALGTARGLSLRARVKAKKPSSSLGGAPRLARSRTFPCLAGSMPERLILGYDRSGLKSEHVLDFRFRATLHSDPTRPRADPTGAESGSTPPRSSPGSLSYALTHDIKLTFIHYIVITEFSGDFPVINELSDDSRVSLRPQVLSAGRGAVLRWRHGGQLADAEARNRWTDGRMGAWMNR